MKYRDAEVLAALERSRNAGLILAQLVGWDVSSANDVLLSGFGEGIYAPQADLLIAFRSHIGRRDNSARCIQETRHSVLFLQVGKSQFGSCTIYMSLSRCAEGRIHWHDELRLWTRGKERECWLLPDPEGSYADGAAFRLGAFPLRPTSERPWKNQREHDFGFGCADTLLINSGLK